LLRRAGEAGVIGRFQLEAAVQSAHGARRLTGRTDWAAVERLYDALCTITGSPVAAVNHAVALSEVQGPRAGLAALEALAADARLAQYQPYWAARAELLSRCGDGEGAARAYVQAIGLESDAAVRAFLREKAAAVPLGRPR
jgi:RNA polymerase sigma-70 factor (ECF subfamily)